MPKSLYAALVALSLIWGGSFYFIKLLLEETGPWMIAFLRSSFGLVTITAVMLLLRKPFGLRSVPWIPMAVMALFNTAVPWALIGFSETRLSSGMASVLNATTPLWTIIVGTLFFRNAAGRLQWAGMLTALAGMMVLLGVNPSTIISVDGIGFACMLAATLCYGIGSQLSRRLTGLSMYQLTFGTLLCSAAGSGIAAFSTEPFPTAAFSSGSFIGALAGIGVFGSGIAYIIFYYLIQKGSPEFATMVTYLVPVSAIVWGYSLLGEPLHWNLLAGLAVILGGVFLATRGGRQAGGGKASLAPAGKSNRSVDG
ncbi:MULTISPECIES: EamA family transporter [unclassified Paenibacillus]|uniref:DMT family transporter n=1 Tax=unclassified Paenibacillus TaxID=185978 RepID=UPI0009557146|nr:MULTISPECIES: EamA family transporter [unclassified Paenibacillus]ASS68287.1 EamA family transporter [Paenibacillus sp. RUD330]SIR27575.1 Permease of the drug/metabolite transporter (DMT) superfamily [Paenibacillus sp. RU4X]SIR40150.1 Permease of the drug/metabolite transporter (DMT) superfamily [Paenibacillus sp. RU4T]